MGIFKTIGNWFRKITGAEPKSRTRKSKKKTILEEEAKTEEVKREIKEIKPRVKKKIPIIEEEVEEEQEEVEIKAPEEKKEIKPSKIELFKKKNRELRPRFKQITDATKKDWEAIINQRKVTISTGYYNSYEKLFGARYDIYRNIILGAISESNPKSKEIIQQIYQSGVLDEHIVARVKIITKTAGSNRPDRFDEIEYEIIGLTPDKALQYNIHNRIMEFRGGNSFALRRHVENICQTEIYESGKHGDSDISVMGVEISFNYA